MKASSAGEKAGRRAPPREDFERWRVTTETLGAGRNSSRKWILHAQGRSLASPPCKAKHERRTHMASMLGVLPLKSATVAPRIRMSKFQNGVV